MTTRAQVMVVVIVVNMVVVDDLAHIRRQPSKHAVQDLKGPGNGPLLHAAGRCRAISYPVRHVYRELTTFTLLRVIDNLTWDRFFYICFHSQIKCDGNDVSLKFNLYP